jgi:hypothetical protein
VSIAGYDKAVSFGDPTTVNQPRRFILGARWSF